MVFALGGLALYSQRSAKPVEQAAKIQTEEPVFAEIVDDPPPAQAATAPELPPPPATRDLHQPMASSRQQIINKLISYSPPKVGQRVDTDVNAVYRGFYEAAPGKFRRIQFTRGSQFIVEIETLEQRFKKWTDGTGDLIVENLEGDPYSLALTLPDRRIFYTKFFADQDLDGYNSSGWRILKGWIVSPAGAYAQKLALIDGTMPELEDLHERKKYVWPQLSVIQKILPGDLP